MSMIVERPSSNSQSRHKPIETRNTREEDSDSSDSFAVRSEDDGSLESLFDDYQNPAWPIPEKTLCDSANPRGVDLILNALRAMTMDFTQREYLTVTTIIVMMESGVISKTEMGAARALLLHTVLLRDCQLSDRAIAHTAGSEEQRTRVKGRAIRQRAGIVHLNSVALLGAALAAHSLRHFDVELCRLGCCDRGRCEGTQDGDELHDYGLRV